MRLNILKNNLDIGKFTVAGERKEVAGQGFLRNQTDLIEEHGTMDNTNIEL